MKSYISINTTIKQRANFVTYKNSINNGNSNGNSNGDNDGDSDSGNDGDSDDDTNSDSNGHNEGDSIQKIRTKDKPGTLVNSKHVVALGLSSSADSITWKLVKTN